jgi:hypothetical protein
MAEAEALLDWLENHDGPAAEVVYEDGHGFVVRWPTAQGPMSPSQ